MPISRHRRKKGKGPVPRINTPKGKLDFFDTKLGERVLYAGVISLIIAMLTSSNILFYPFMYTVYAAVPFFFIALFYFWNDFKAILFEKFAWDTILVIPLWLLTSAFSAALCISIFVIPFNFYIKEKCKNNPIETYRCSIDYISIINGKNSRYTTYYIFKNETFGQLISFKKAEELKENDTYKKYYVHLEVRKGPFDTYVIQNWEHRLKPIL